KKTANGLICYLLFLNLAQAQQVFPGGGMGSYNLTFPPGPYSYPNNPPSSCGSGAPGVSHYQRPGHNYFRSAIESPKVVSGFSQHPQTNDWWSSAIWNYETNCNWAIAPYSFYMYPHPLQIAATRYGLRISYENDPVIVPTLTYIHHRETHLYVGLQGMDVPASVGTKVKRYGDWDVTLQWDDGTRRLEATAAHGSPYVY
ncbi:MAG: hypothetical protein NZ529_11770, partial [Cytophagaceae bacterium]|nr:hypothetical protein [Cytophagaceae bacterium]MDW8457461.1 hypothetical protein [Cytophagaceae bacterium]